MKGQFKLTLVVAAAIATVVVTSIPASAAIVNAGDTIRITDGRGHPSAGEFGVKVKNTDGSFSGVKFYTFCVQRQEFINYNEDIYIESITTTVKGVGGGPLSSGARWLYSQWNKGGLVDTTIAGPNNVYKQTNFGQEGLVNTTSLASDINKWGTALQEAIWQWEGESIAPAGLASIWRDLAIGMEALDVMVMNLKWRPASQVGGDAQDLLVFVPRELEIESPVPEAGSLAVWSILGASGLCFGMIRQRSRKA